jgi:hypothetical protein
MSAGASGGYIGHGALAQARPDRAGRQQIGQVQRVDERTAHVLDTVPRQTAQEGVQRVDRLDPGREAHAVDGLFYLACRLFQAGTILIHEHDDAGVIPHGHQSTIDFGNRGFGIADHRKRVLVDVSAVRVEHLVEEAAHLLPPLLAELVQVGHGLVLIHEDETARPTVFARQLTQGG